MSYFTYSDLFVVYLAVISCRFVHVEYAPAHPVYYLCLEKCTMEILQFLCPNFNVPAILLHLQGRVDDFSFFDCFSPFCFLFIKFHLPFFILYKNITILCLLLLCCDYVAIGRRGFFFFRARFASFHTHASLTSSVSLSYSCCSLAQVFGKTLLHEFHISYSHIELRQSTSAHFVFRAKK